MLSFIRNTSKKTVLAWSALFLVYALFIAIFSYLYPYGADEYILRQESIIEALKQYIFSYSHENARIGLIANNIILSLGKWSFIVLNPLVQIIWILSFFGLIYLRLPNLKDFKDFPAMLLIAILSIFAVAQPDNTIFWIGGACNYSWSILPFFWILTWLRFEYQTKGNLALSKQAIVGLFITAIVLGMSSENSGPLTMGLMVCFVIGCRLAGLKLKSHFYIIMLGLTIGLTLLFAAPAMWNRLNTDIFAYFNDSTLQDKLLWHISHIHFYLKAIFMIPVFTFLALLICILDKDKPFALKNQNYALALIFFISACILAAVLFVVPFITGRCFYTASVTALISMIFMMRYLYDTYNFKLIRYTAIFAAAAVISYMPSFTYPYIHLYNQDKARMHSIQQAKAVNQKTIFMMPYKYLKAPNANLTIMYYDPLYGFLGYADQIGLKIQTDEKAPVNALYIYSNANVI